MKKLNPDVMLLIVAIIWGAGFIGTEYAIDSNMSPMMILSGRFIVASVTLLPFIVKDINKIKRREWFRGSLAGLFLFLGFFFQTTGQSQTTVANSAFLTATNVVFVPFIAWAITTKRPKIKVFLMALLTFVGIAVLSVDLSEGLSMGSGDIMVLISAFMFATHIAFLSLGVEGCNPLRISFIQLTVAGLFATSGLVATNGLNLESVDLGVGVPSVLFLGVFSTCICFFLQTSAQKRTTPGKTAIILSMESLFGTIFSIILGIDPLTAKIVIGGLIILTAVILTEVDFTPKKELKKSS